MTDVNNQRGVLNPRWKGGTSRSTIRRLCKKVLDEAGVDQYVCQHCLRFGRIRQNVHHFDEDRTNNTAENLMVLCPRCHQRIHRIAHELRRDSTTGRYANGNTSSS